MIAHVDPPSSTLRAALRLIALIIAVLLLLPFCAILIVGAGIGGSIARYRMVMSLTPIFCRIMAAALGLRVRITGTRSERARIFVGNHVSYLDILVGGIGVGGVFVSRHDVRDWPVIGIFARLAGTVFIDRRSLRSAISSSAGIVERARQGIRIALFPEGGTTSGESVGEFRPFLFSAISDAGIAVQPFTIIYSHIGSVPITAANKTLVYWYDPAPPFTTHGWRLMKMKNVRATIHFHPPSAPPESGDKSSVRLFADELRRQVADGLQVGGQ
ncbi:MAG: acyltransferase [Chlorobi bacterium]|nr:acyltransferase [Chlorobiota bacterium]